MTKFFNLFMKTAALGLLLFTFSPAMMAQLGTVTGKVADEQGSLTGATIIVKGTSQGTMTDIDGNYSMSLEPGSHTLRVMYAGYGSVDQAVTVNAGESVTHDFVLNVSQLDEVVVVGSRSAPRTQLATAVPVDVISNVAIQNSAYGNVTHVLQYVAPSFHSTPQTISDGTDHIDPATLRGLGPDQVLVLVNGKRRHSSALINVNGTVGRGTVGTDLNTIPASAIKKIEVLRDGAAAQYGSDAIAGVINVVLKENTNLSANLRSGVTSAGDGEENQASVNMGFNMGKRGGFINATIDYLDRASSNRSGEYDGKIFGDSLVVHGPNGDIVYSDNNEADRAAFFAQTPFEGQKVMQVGNSALRNASLTLNAAYPLGGDAELYANTTFNYRNGKARGFYRFPYQQNKVVFDIYPMGFSPIINSDIKDNAFTVGVRGTINGWNADMSQTRGQNSFDFTISNSNNASLGLKSPTSAYAGGFAYGHNISNVDLSRGIDVGFPLNVAFGGEFRLENYQIFEGEEASYIGGGSVSNTLDSVGGSAGIQVFPGFQPQNALNKSRNNIGTYLDLEADFTDALLVGIAARYESYSDFGSNLSYKAVARYKVTDNISARAGYSTGFRAPSLHQIYFNNLSTQFVEVNGQQQAVQVGTFNNESVVTKAFGIESLKPETSQNISVGVTARLTPKLSVTVDAYQIAIEDRIVLSGRFGGADYAAVLNPLGASRAQFFTNAVSTTTQGVDMVIAYKTLLGDKGRLNLSLAGNMTSTEVDKAADGTPVIAGATGILEGKENTIFNREDISRLEVAQPSSKIAFSADYETGPLQAIFHLTQFGKISYLPTNEANDQVFAAKMVMDLELGYKINNNIKVSLGAQNLLDTFPDEHIDVNRANERFVYSRRVQQFGIRGRFTYVKLGFNL